MDFSFHSQCTASIQLAASVRAAELHDAQAGLLLLLRVTESLLRSFAFTSGAFAQLNKTYQN